MIDPEEVEVWWAQPTPHADAMFHVMQKALEDYNKQQVEAGQMPTLSDPISALLSMLGLILGGIEDEEHRRAVYRGCGVMLTLTIQKAIETGATRHIEIIRKGTGTMQ